MFNPTVYEYAGGTYGAAVTYNYAVEDSTVQMLFFQSDGLWEIEEILISE